MVCGKGDSVIFGTSDMGASFACREACTASSDAFAALKTYSCL